MHGPRETGLVNHSQRLANAIKTILNFRDRAVWAVPETPICTCAEWESKPSVPADALHQVKGRQDPATLGSHG